MIAAAPLAQAGETVVNKTDLYVGALGGFSSAIGSATAFGIPEPWRSFSPIEIGVVAGLREYDQNMFFGLEADANVNLAGLSPNQIINFSGETGNEHVRGVVGHQFGDVTLYLAGGLAADQLVYFDASDGTENKTFFGWTAGIGAEFAATDNISLRIEALHDETSGQFNDGYNGKWIENTLRAGAAFHF